MLEEDLTNDVLFNVSQDYAYFLRNGPVAISKLHSPFFLVLGGERERKKVSNEWEKKKTDKDDIFSRIKDIKEVEEYKSFWKPSTIREVFKVETYESYVVPEVSDKIFFKLGIPTAEHDIPYVNRALVDLSALKDMWIFDTKGRKEILDVLLYDIEISDYGEKENGRLPIGIIGYSDFKFSFRSEKNLEEEDFNLNIIDIPSDWESIEIKQLISRDEDEEVENLKTFLEELRRRQIICGHNILNFDNREIYNRIEYLSGKKKDELSTEEKRLFRAFLDTSSRKERIFNFGSMQGTVNIYPTSFDTYHAARKFFPNLDGYGLKYLAPLFGIKIKDRVYLDYDEIGIDEKTLEYNRHDVTEQGGITLLLLQQALPLAFLTGLPFEILFPAGTTKIWDQMAMIRAAKYKKIFPATCKVSLVSKQMIKEFGNKKEKKRREEIFQEARKLEDRSEYLKEALRVIKYGEEMPDWVEYPYVNLEYHFPGGKTIKPNEVDSDFLLWWNVIVADVGAMYPTILRAGNIGADTVRLSKKDEIPDDYVWLKSLPKKFLGNICWKDAGDKEGYLVGIKKSKEDGMVNLAMKGIMKMIFRIKRELSKAKAEGVSKEEVQRMQMMYNALKGVRNAGTHGIMTAPNVSCRQFNLWAGAAITTKGQEILDDVLERLNERDIRVVYGDTDGIYAACSKTAPPEVCDLLKNRRFLGYATTLRAEEVAHADKTKNKKIITRKISDFETPWLSEPEKVLRTIEDCNEIWRERLNYPDFELEPEEHSAMLFVKHKNYLVWDIEDGELVMKTKGNNFRASDKAEITAKTLEKIMQSVVRDNISWESEKDEKIRVKDSINEGAKEIISNLNLDDVDVSDLIMTQTVSPPKTYARNRDGSMNTFGQRAAALEKIVGKIGVSTKFRFVVTKSPLPGINNPNKSGVKPIHYMYPIDYLTDEEFSEEIDIEWYRKLVGNYIKGAFGIEDASTGKNMSLDLFM